MNTQFKALTFALLFIPAVAMATEDFKPGDWLYDIYSGAYLEESRANSDVAMDVNKTIEQEPTAAGARADYTDFPIVINVGSL